MILSKNNSKSSLNSFKSLIEKKIGKIHKSKKLSSDKVYNWYTLIIDRHMYSLYIPIKPENSNTKKNYRNAVINRIKLLNKKERSAF